MKKIIVAIDGHSSCGKSTMAKDLAREVGYIYVDTGAMYRAVTLFALQHKLFNADGSVKADELEGMMKDVVVDFKLDPETKLPLVHLNGECVEKQIRGMEVSSHVSPIAALPFVRQAMTAQQQRMGRDKGIVMDGRDIGTVVFRMLNLKFLLLHRLKCVPNVATMNLKLKGKRQATTTFLKMCKNATTSTRTAK